MLLQEVKNPELGYYQVGDKIHLSKTTALIDGTQRNIHPEWKFNNHVFDYYDWTVEPSESLEELYRQRAVRLREKYDHLVLMYSGGADSDTILQTCLKNNIHIDEVAVVWPRSFDRLYTPNANNFEELNMLSEWDFTVRPKLDWLAQNHPEIKITVFDWAEGILEHKVKDDYLLDRSQLLSPYWDHRLRFYTEHRARDKKANVGFISGVDKPRICFSDGAYRLYFLDIVTMGMGPQASAEYRKDKLSLEFFYWSSDSCKILAKQAHLLVKYFEMFPAFKQYIQWPVANPNYRTWYESSVKAVIYPNYDMTTFQANKFTEMTVSFDQYLFKLGMEDKIMGQTRDNTAYIKQMIDPKYLNEIKGLTTFTGFITGMWPIKTVA